MKKKNGNGTGNGEAERKQCSGCFLLMAEQEKGMQMKYGLYFHAGDDCINKYKQSEKRRKEKEAARQRAAETAQTLAYPA